MEEKESLMYQKHVIIQHLQNKSPQWLLTCQQEQQWRRLEHDGAATANRQTEQKSPALLSPEVPALLLYGDDCGSGGGVGLNCMVLNLLKIIIYVVMWVFYF